MASILGIAIPYANGADQPPQPSRNISFAFSGVVHIPISDVDGITPICEPLVVKWKCADGQSVMKGDPLIIYDSTMQQERLVDKTLSLRKAIAQQELDEIQLTNEMQSLTDMKRSLESHLAVIQVMLSRLHHTDIEQIALLASQHDLDTQRVAVGQRELGEKENLLSLGEISYDEVMTARLQLQKADNEAAISRLAWLHQETYTDDMTIAELEVKEHELLMQLGNNAGTDGKIISGHQGLIQRIKAFERQIESARKNNKAAVDRARKDAHKQLRDAYDHTPITFIEVNNNESLEPIRQICFGPTGSNIPEGFVLDDGAVYDPQRGYGWDRDVRNATHLRNHGNLLEAGVVAVRRPATWRCAIPNGTYQLRIGVGDAVDWHGPVIYHRQRALFASRHLEERQVVETTIEVHSGEITLRCSDEYDKALRAPDDGVGRPQPWLTLGHHVRWQSWPIAYFSPQAKLKVQGLVRQDDVSLLKVHESTETLEDQVEIDDDFSAMLAEYEAGNADHESHASLDPKLMRTAKIRGRLATSKIFMETAEASHIGGHVTTIGTSPVKINRGAGVWYRGEEKTGKDLIARHVLITPSPDQVGRLRLGQTVRCTARITPEPQMRVLPAHLVSQKNRHYFVQISPTGNKQQIEGIRVGQSFVVTDGLPADAAVMAMINKEDKTHAATHHFTGEVVAGKRVNVGLSDHWGVIDYLAEDGSHVEKDQLIISITNPSLDAKRNELAEEKIKARQNYLLAMETRRVKTIEAKIEHERNIFEERRRRIHLHQLMAQDPVELERSRLAFKQTSLEAALHHDRSERLSSIPSTPSRDLKAAKANQQIAEYTELKTHLDHVEALWQLDWLELNNARREWMDAVEALSLRDQALQIIRKEEQVARLAADVNLRRALEGTDWEREFDAAKDIRAPVAGRLFYLSSWNDHARSRTKISKGISVWRGLPLAQILDMSELGMKAEIPQEYYSQLSLGAPAVLGFRQYPGVTVNGRIDELGRSFFVPKEKSHADHEPQTLNLQRVFSITVRFSPPKELADEFVPGTKGFIAFP